MGHWLFKSEPSTFSFDDLKARAGRREPWNGVRNYQVRNFIRDAMAPGDRGLFYHSSCPVPGVAGVIEVASDPYPDPSQFDPGSPYFDPKSTETNPRWLLVDVEWIADFPHYVTLTDLRNTAPLAGMAILKRGNRLSITPVTPAEFRTICKLGGWNPSGRTGRRP